MTWIVEVLPALPPSSDWTQSFQNVLIAVPATIFALAAFVAARKGNVKADTAIAQNDTLVKATGDIKTQTDGHLSTLAAELKAANEKMLRMEKIIALLEQKWGRGPGIVTTEVELAREADVALAKFKEEHDRTVHIP